MYNSYFGFRESPFSISPDPRFFYANSVYLEAYASLRYGIEAKKGFVAVIGRSRDRQNHLIAQANAPA